MRKPKWKGELMGRAGGEGRETGMGGAPPFTNPIDTPLYTQYIASISHTHDVESD